MTWWMWDIQDNNRCWNYSKKTTGGQDSKKMLRNIYKGVLGVNKTKSSTRRNQELHLLEISQGSWQDINIDIIGPLPRSNGMDTIVVIVDWFTKMIWLKATTTNISLKGIIKIYRDDIWKLYGIPKKILSNRGLQFVSKFMKEFTKALGMKRQLLTAYHPQTDGQTERINQEIGTFL